MITTILAFLFVLGVLVFIHELGHFLVARFYGVRVHTFSLGFGPKILKVTRGNTEYCISAVPLGGYVKLAGESVTSDGVSGPASPITGAPDEFLSKSRWVRFQVYLAGPVMNILLAVVLLAFVLMRGADVPLYTSSAAMVGRVAAGSAGERAGLRTGDRITRVNSHNVSTWSSFFEDISMTPDREVTLTLVRDGQTMTLKATPEAVVDRTTKFTFGDLGVEPLVRPQFAMVTPGRPAEAAGFKKGDVVLGIGAERGLAQPDIIKRIRASVGKPLTFHIERDKEPITIEVTPDATGMIGASILPYETRRVDPNFVQAFQLSAEQNWDQAATIGRTLKGLVTTETPVKQLVGPLGIAQMSGEAVSLGFAALINLMAMISLNLGLLNLMPIPVFDGGQIALLFLEGFYQRVFNRDLSLKVKERILLVGAALVILLMVTVIYNDVVRIWMTR